MELTCKHRLISTCKIAKEAWDILAETHKGDNVVKCYKLQQLTIEFENLRIHDHEEITNFNAKIFKISNESCLLGKKIYEKELVRKILRSLLGRFILKVVSTEELVILIHYLKFNYR